MVRVVESLRGWLLTKTDVGLSNVDNTSDAAKPMSTATQTYVDSRTLDNLADVSVPSPTNGYVVAWNGSQWSAVAPTSGPQGPPGPPGASNSAYTAVWRWNASTGVPPISGQIRTNTGDAVNATT